MPRLSLKVGYLLFLLAVESLLVDALGLLFSSLDLSSSHLPLMVHLLLQKLHLLLVADAFVSPDSELIHY